MMGNDEQIVNDPSRQSFHAMWSSVAPAWSAHADDIDARETAVTEAMLEFADLCHGKRVLELGCGPGGVGIAAAEIVGSDGVVVLSDIEPKMTAIAEQRARRRGLDNVMTAEIDLQRIDYPDYSFDAVLCREALMLVPDPASALLESHRILRDGGCAVFAVWGSRELNPWLGVLLDAMQARLGIPLPPPSVPGPFSISDDGALKLLLQTAGFGETSVRTVAAPMKISSVDEWWTLVPSLAGPVAQILASLPVELSGAIRADAAAAFSRFARSSGYELPGVSIVGSGRRRT
jgi:ubiquinone/menaquinone biosynthesis C-methylase UbiE